ncbi:DUF5333 family protein [uncultured Litoreibacter sp.]|uniref:DUF5333 family protein n=1 Tax=uncultured Litoreibacter sp. TaxID=1392394 RepID=UPI0026372CC6|nr:DUF5333 family protein [uncultured Litoreibacter sp.]
MSSVVKFGPFAAATFLVAAPALADMRPMPDYFVSALVATSAAQSLALSCAELRVDPLAVIQASEALQMKLEADGFNSKDPFVDMESGEAQLTKAQQVFADKHQLETASGEAVCAAGRSEISQGSDIGALLVEVAQ